MTRWHIGNTEHGLKILLYHFHSLAEGGHRRSDGENGPPASRPVSTAICRQLLKLLKWLKSEWNSVIHFNEMIYQEWIFLKKIVRLLKILKGLCSTWDRYLADFQVDEHADARKNVDFDSFVYFFLKLEINWFGGWVQLFSVRLFTWIRCIDLKINLEFFGYKNCLIGWRFTLKLQNCGSGIFSLTRPGAKVRHVKVTISLATGNTWTCRLTRSSIAHFQTEISFNDFSSAKHSLH